MKFVKPEEKTFPYPGKFTFVDVEIPNVNNNCICAVSLIVIENHREIVRHTELINPQTFFSPPNIKIHKIRPKDVKNKRTFPQFWSEYGKYFSRDYIIGAHNALSDISVLNKDLARISRRFQAERYLDTMDIMRDFYYKGSQKKGDLKLSGIADRLDIALDHHNPQSDVNCCLEIVRYMDDHFSMDLQPFIRQVPVLKTAPAKRRAKPSTMEAASLIAAARRKISSSHPSTHMKASSARRRGDAAFAALNYPELIFFYETASARKCRDESMYLRLSSIYDSLGLPWDALRILETGLKNLRAAGSSTRGLMKTLDKKRSRLKKTS